jgi:CRISPR/Cas system-associated exonuclease Cas4 (RecB family)
MTEKQPVSHEVIVIGAAGNSVAVLTHDLFKDIDFSGISSAIDKIGGHAGKMEPEEKTMANDIVDQWQKDVVSRLRTKGNEMHSFINFFEVGSDGRVNGMDLLDEIGDELAVKTNSVKQFENLQALIEELLDVHETRPAQPTLHLDIDQTQAAILEEENTFRLETKKYDMAVSKKKREIYLAEREWKKLLKQNKEVVDLIKKGKRFNKDMGKFTDMCHDKAQIAKLNITVGDADVRQALKELLNFSTTV